MPIQNSQSTLVLGQVLQMSGAAYPSRDNVLVGDAPLLGVIRTVAFDYDGAEAQGQLQAIAQNSALYSLIGVHYGGDGRTNFAIPDLAGRVSIDAGSSTLGMRWGEGSLTLTRSQMPAALQGGGQAVNNIQPGLEVNWLIRIEDDENHVAGEMMQFAGAFAPGGWVAAEGQTLSRSVYGDLFDRIGYAYGGAGDTFKLPDLVGRTIIGADAQTPVGSVVGSETFTIGLGNLPSAVGGAGDPIDNRGPAVAMKYYISYAGLFPSSDSPLGYEVVGEVRAFAGTPPSGWLLCDGAELSIANYQVLYAVIGDAFGQTGPTTFRLPDLQGRAVVGAGGDFDVGETLGSNQIVLQLSDLPLVAPTNTAPATVTAEIGSGTYVFGDSAITVADADSATLTVKLTVAHGKLTLGQDVGLTVTGDGTGEVTLQGQVSAVNSALTGLTYVADAGYRGADTLTIVTSDGALSETDTVAIGFPNVAPAVTAGQALQAAENQVVAGTVIATDPNGGSPSLALVTGDGAAADNALFTLDASGALRFRAAPDFEGAHGASYTVNVVATDAGGLTSAPQTVTVTVTNANDAPTGTVAIGGTAAEGQVLTATSALSDPDGLQGVTYSYQWRAGGVDIGGATGATYTLTAAEVGKAITVAVRYTDQGGFQNQVVSSATGAVSNTNDAPTGGLTVSGQAAQGQTLTVTSSLADADGMAGATLTYQWRADGQAIQGATGPSFMLGQAQVGKVITVTAGYVDDGGASETVTSAPTAAVADVNDPPAGAVTISGAAAQGQALSAANTLSDVDGITGQVAYQWKAGGQAIAGATGATFTPGQAQVGQAITVTASYVDGGGRTESVTSAPTAAVANVNDLPSGAVSLTGSAQVGATLTAGHTLVDPDGLGTLSWQWSADGAPIAGATGGSLVLTNELLGKVIRVTASFVDLGGAAESVTSGGSAPVAAQPPPQPQPDPEPPPPPPPPPQVIDGAPVQTGTVVNSDGSTSQVITIPVITETRTDQQGPGATADIPLVLAPGGAPLLQAQLPTGFGLQATGMTAPGTAGQALAELMRSVSARAAADQVAGLLSQSAEYLSALANGLLVQTITPTVSGGGSGVVSGPLVISGATAGATQAGIVLDARGLPGDTVIELQNVAFAVVVGDVRLTGGAGSQTVIGDGGTQYMILGADDDELHGGGGDDVVGSLGGDDTLTGDDGFDTVTGGEGADRLEGGADGDFVHGNQGNDVVHGNQGADSVYGGQGDDIVLGGRDDDLVWGDLGDDRVLGDLGDDSLNGNGGADTLSGGDGRDVLRGGQDGDILLGGAGDDLLFGDRGDDTLSGGAGADRFVFTADGGADVAADFNFAGGDRLALDPALRGAAWSVSANAAGDAVVTVAGAGSLVLNGVAAAAVGEGWFV